MPLIDVSTDRSTRLLLWLIGLSLQSVTVLWLLDLPAIKDYPERVFASGILALGGIAFSANYAFKSCDCTFSPSAIFFSLTTWSALVDLLISASLIGMTTLGKFYVETGEEYFKSSWGVAVLAYDGCVHYFLQLYLAHATLLDRPRLLVGLFWSGSILNSMPVVLLGGATGMHSDTLKPSTLLNAPYVLAPILYLSAILPSTHRQPLQRPAGGSKEAGGAKEVTVRAWRSASSVDHLLVLFHMAALCLHCFRAAVVLGSKSPAALGYGAGVEPALLASTADSFGFLRVQLLEYFFYYVPFHAWAIACAYLPPTESHTAWATVVAGGYMQAQATYVGSAAFQWVDFEPLARLSTPTTFWLVAIGFACLPAAYAARCWQQIRAVSA